MDVVKHAQYSATSVEYNYTLPLRIRKASFEIRKHIGVRDRTGAAAVRSTERGRWQQGQAALPSAQPSRYSLMHTCDVSRTLAQWSLNKWRRAAGGRTARSLIHCLSSAEQSVRQPLRCSTDAAADTCRHTAGARAKDTAHHGCTASGLAQQPPN